jgi:hypothetical protein
MKGIKTKKKGVMDEDTKEMAFCRLNLPTF